MQISARTHNSTTNTGTELENMHIYDSYTPHVPHTSRINPDKIIRNEPASIF